MVRLLNRKLRREFGRIFRPEKIHVPAQQSPAPFDEGWPEERAYWHETIRTFYREAYNLELDPAQTDESLIAPTENVREIQRTDKAHPDVYFSSGYRTAMNYQIELRDHGASIDQMDRVLEMGVGLGRLIIHLFPFKAQLFGCDVTPNAIDWVQARLAHRINAHLTGLEPPLPYADAMFDLVYANSVFTHIPCSLTTRWAAELRRIIRPGGSLIFSVFDPNHYMRETTYRDFHKHFAAAGCAEWNQDRGVHLMTYHTPQHIRETWTPHFDVLEIRQHFRDQSHVICRRRPD